MILLITKRDQKGLICQIDPSFPLALPLSGLLRKLEQFYPLPPFYPKEKPQTIIPSSAWNGDRFALFGGPIATSILLSLGSMDWTFKRLCAEISTGYDVVVVSKVVDRLLSEDLLEADRAAGPGFNIRTLRLSSTFAAQLKLRALLRIAVHVWPEFNDRLVGAFERMPKRTIVQLTNMKLLPAPWELDEGPKRGRRTAIKRCDAIAAKYCMLAAKQLRALSTNDLRAIDHNLYYAIRNAFGGFAQFRKYVGLPPVRDGSSTSKSQGLKETCIREYEALASELGYLPNTSYLNAHRSWLARRILIQWGGFTPFCDELNLRTVGRKPIYKLAAAEKRARCRLEYLKLMKRLGKRPTSRDLNMHTDGLAKRIGILWDSFEIFCEEVGVQPPRRFAGKSGGDRRWARSSELHDRCVSEYRALCAKLRFEPNSNYLARNARTLLGNIYVQWGSFKDFCAELGVSPPKQSGGPKVKTTANTVSDR